MTECTMDNECVMCDGRLVCRRFAKRKKATEMYGVLYRASFLAFLAMPRHENKRQSLASNLNLKHLT